jgi:hypothetical protein
MSGQGREARSKRQEQISVRASLREVPTKQQSTYSAVEWRNVMRKLLTTMALFAVTSLVAVNNVSAQEHAVQASIPFDFTVNGALLPPGTYWFKSTSSNQVFVQNKARGASALANGFSDDKNSQDVAKIVFDRVGDQYFLHEIVATSAGQSVSLPVSKLEKQVKMQHAALQSETKTVLAMK